MGYKVHANVLPAPPMALFQWMVQPSSSMGTGPTFISYYPHHNKNMKVRTPRRRRAFSELSRDISCPHVECGKCYASKHALNLHLRIKHMGSSLPIVESNTSSESDDIRAKLNNADEQSFSKNTSVIFNNGIETKNIKVEKMGKEFQEEESKKDKYQSMMLPPVHMPTTMDVKPQSLMNVQGQHNDINNSQTQDPLSLGLCKMSRNTMSENTCTPRGKSPESQYTNTPCSTSSFDTPMLSSPYPLATCDIIDSTTTKSIHNFLDSQTLSSLGETFPLVRSNSCPTTFDMPLPEPIIQRPSLGPDQSHSTPKWPNVYNTSNPSITVGICSSMRRDHIDQSPFITSLGYFTRNSQATRTALTQSMGLIGLDDDTTTAEGYDGFIRSTSLVDSLSLHQQVDDAMIRNLFYELKNLMS